MFGIRHGIFNKYAMSTITFFMKKKIIYIGFILLLNSTYSCKIPQPTTNTDPSISELYKQLSDNEYILIPMTKSLSGHLHLTGELNGVTANFILDTGANGTVIETTRQEQFKMTLTGVEDMGSGAGSVNLQVADSEGNRVQLGNLTLENFDLKLMSLEHVNQAFEGMGMERIDGVLGADILEQGQAVIDYSNLILYLKKLVL